MKIKGDTVIFNSGREEYANNGIIGIDSEGDLAEGYDGGFCVESHHDSDDRLTPDERIDLAEFMIARWQKFKGDQSDK